MRIAHFSDSHLGAHPCPQRVGRDRDEREVDVERALSRTVDQIIAAQPDATVFAGDLFDGGRPTNHSLGFAVREFRRLREGTNGPLVVISGNHDAPLRRENGHPFEVVRRVKGIDCVYRSSELLEYPEIGLSVFAFPDAALRVSDEKANHVAPDLSVRGAGRYRILVLHAGIRGVGQYDRDPASWAVPASAIPSEWDYVAVGDYHVAHQVKTNTWYSGALDYVSSDPWSELKEEVAHQVRGKGWLLADLAAGTVAFHGPVNDRPVIDLPQIDGYGLTAAEVTARILASVAAVDGGHADKVIRQVVLDVPRETERLLDHQAIRRVKAAMLHFRLDIRRPANVIVIGGESATVIDPVEERDAFYRETYGRPWDLLTDREKDEATAHLSYEPSCGNEPVEVLDSFVAPNVDYDGTPFDPTTCPVIGLANAIASTKDPYDQAAA